MAARKAVADEVAALMGRHRMSQTQLAEAIGATQSYVSRRLAYVKPFDVDDLYAIAEHFDVPVSDLVAPATLPTDARSDSSAGDLVLVGTGI